MQDEDPPQMPMPQYQCHKKVWALKVAGFVPYAGPKEGEEALDCAGLLHFVDKRYSSREVSAAFVSRLSERAKVEIAGWYFVVYDDGYESMSPSEAFEAGYSLIG